MHPFDLLCTVSSLTVLLDTLRSATRLSHAMGPLSGGNFSESQRHEFRLSCIVFFFGFWFVVVVVVSPISVEVYCSEKKKPLGVWVFYLHTQIHTQRDTHMSV